MISSKTKTVLSIICAIFLLFAVSATAQEEYLWNPKLAWEDTTKYNIVGGIKIIKNDEQIIYFADGEIYLRELKTGNLIAKSKKFPNGQIDMFSISDDLKTIYAPLKITQNTEKSYTELLKINSNTLEIERKTRIYSGNDGVLYSDINNNKYYIRNLIGLYPISDNDFRLIYKTRNPLGTPWDPSNKIVEGFCILKIDLSTNLDSYEDSINYKLEFFEYGLNANFGFGGTSSFHSDFIITIDTKNNFKIIDKVNYKEIYNSANNIIYFSPNGKYIFRELVDFVEVIDMNSLQVVNKCDINLITFPRNGYNLKLSSNYDNNPNHFFYPSLLYLGGDSLKYNYFSLDDNKIKKIMPIIDDFLNLDMHIDRNATILFCINGSRLQVYNLNPKVSVNENRTALPTLKSDNKNAYIPLDNSLPKNIIFYNYSGKEIFSITNEFNTIDNQVIIDISNLQTGLYLISVEFENNSTQSFKFIK